MIYRTLATLLAITVVTGCGFHLRGQDTVNLVGLEKIHITGLSEYDPMYRALTQALSTAGVEISDAAATPARLRIGEYRRARRVFAVDSRNKAVEYELEETFVFALRNVTGIDDTAEQRLQTVRLIRNPEDEVLGRGREEEWLREDMRRQLAEQVVERIAAQLR